MDSEDWHPPPRFDGVAALILLVSRYRWIYLAATTGFIGLRLALGSLFFRPFEAHRARYLVCGLGCLLLACLIVKVGANRS
jgi:hypothetical protein